MLSFRFFQWGCGESVDKLEHLGIQLDEKQNFYNHIEENISKNNRDIRIIKNIQHKIPRILLSIIYKIQFRNTSQHKLCEELGLESLKLRRKLWRLCTFYKIESTGLLASYWGSYQIHYIPSRLGSWIMLPDINTNWNI